MEVLLTLLLHSYPPTQAQPTAITSAEQGQHKIRLLPDVPSIEFLGETVSIWISEDGGLGQCRHVERILRKKLRVRRGPRGSRNVGPVLAR